MKIEGNSALSTYKSIMELQKDIANQIIQMLPQNNMQTQEAVNNQTKETKTPPPNPDGKLSIYA